MAIEEIIRRIELESQARVDEILVSAREEEKNILTKANVEAHEIKQKIIESGEADLASQKEWHITVARLEERNKLLGEKQKIISQVYEEVLRRLKTLSPDEYQRLIKNLVLRLANGGEEIIMAENDRAKINESFLEGINMEFQKKQKTPLTLSFSHRHLEGGLILRSPQSEINATFPLLLRAIREKTESQIVRILFGNEQD